MRSASTYQLSPREPVADDVPPKISVAIVVGVCLYRDGLARALSQCSRLAVVASVSRVPEAEAAIEEYHPDIVLLDSGVDPDFTLAAVVGRVSPSTRMVALGVHEVEDDVLRCAEAGLSAYVPREASIDDLVVAIELAARGELRCSPGIAASLFRRAGSMADPRATPEPQLTRRERQVVKLIDEGMSNKQIARTLQIEVSTVKNHVHNLLTKLDVPRRTVAAARARRLRSRVARPVANEG